MKTYNISICQQNFELTDDCLRSLLTERAYKLYRKVRIQGGSVDFSMKAINPKYLKNEEHEKTD